MFPTLLAVFSVSIGGLLPSNFRTFAAVPVERARESKRGGFETNAPRQGAKLLMVVGGWGSTRGVLCEIWCLFPNMSRKAVAVNFLKEVPSDANRG